MCSSDLAVRDAIGYEDRTTFKALERAALTGVPAAVDLSFIVTSDWQMIEVDDLRDGGWQLTRPAKGADLDRPRVVSDDGWAMTVHGGALFSDSDTATSWPSNRLVGTYDVTLDESGKIPTFVLQVIDGGTPDVAPPTRDREICGAINDARVTSGTFPENLQADLDYLVGHPADFTSQRYAEIRARWVDSPRVWWALSLHADLVRAGEGIESNRSEERRVGKECPV